MDNKDLKTILITDCGSTTTKAVLFENRKEGWRQAWRGEAPTTVEEPVADVTVGAINAFQEIQEISRRQILSQSANSDSENPFCFTKEDPNNGIDLYLSTSSAGGGLQMIVGGIVRNMSTESAQRAALGAGAIVMDTISADDGREDYKKIERIRHLKPDIVLMAGGVDGGARNHLIEMAEILFAASPRPRFGETIKLPVVYAGNHEALEEVRKILEKTMQFIAVDNLRPNLETENLGPAREAIHDFFLSHVMSHAPGYGKLLNWSPQPIMPTPAAVGNIVESLAKRKNIQVLAVDIGGATTDVFSVFNNPISSKREFNRTVSANYGMSYSIANVLVEAGIDNIMRWLPYQISASEVRDRLRNKMIRPTSIPQTIQDLLLEQAVCREALRLSLDHHRSLAVGLSGIKQSGGIANIFAQKSNRSELVNLLQLDMVIGSGGVLSHAPERVSAALMMLDGFGLQGLTQLCVDSIFMMPHLGVLACVHPEAAEEVLFKDCLVNLGHAVVPVFKAKSKITELARVSLDHSNSEIIRRGQVILVPQKDGVKQRLKIEPLANDVDVGAGPGQTLETEVVGGCVGLILDGRNRPIEWPKSREQLVTTQRQYYENLGLRV